MAKVINVNLSDKRYPIIIGNDALLKTVQKINDLSVSKCLLVIDQNIIKYHPVLIRKTFAMLNCKVYSYPFVANEKNKSLNQTEKIYKFLLDNSFDRNSIIVALGGGITGDIAGYAASTYMRGIRFIQIPTTLLSMVDSSVGGKTGVNFYDQKNMIGTFYQPEFVAIYPEFLSTLSRRELQSGAGEILKYSFLADNRNYSLLKNNLLKLFTSQLFAIEKTINACLVIKSNIVENDEKEITGLRKILNFGHTFAHAFEAASNYKLKHGEAVIGGIYCALFLSEILGYITSDKLNSILNDYKFIRPNKKLVSLNMDNIFNSMGSDKKNSMGKKRFVLIEDIGKIVVDVVSERTSVLKSIEKLNDQILKTKSL
jgi:3-dehydroquinate synthase